MRKQLKMAAFAALLAVGFTANAQQTSGDITQQTNTGLGQADSYVKVIDNKGTIKYLQAKNGITTFTNTTPAGGEITTWQLGGTLDVDTKISFGAKGAAGQTSFTLDGEKFILENIEQVTAGVEANEFDATGAVTKTNWEVLVREGVDGSAEGTVRKVALTELLKVQGFHNIVKASATDQTSKKVEITVAGLPATVNPYKIWVYRNGAKLQSGKDYTFTAEKVTVDGTAATGGDFPIYENDEFEIHYIK